MQLADANFVIDITPILTWFPKFQVDFDTPEIVEEEEPEEEPEEPPRESLVVRESGVFPPKRFDGSPPPYENALAAAAQERRSNSGEAGPTGSLLNPLHSTNNQANSLAFLFHFVKL